jgi:hypothetical protein
MVLTLLALSHKFTYVGIPRRAVVDKAAIPQSNYALDGMDKTEFVSGHH